MSSRRWILALAVVLGLSGCTRTETSREGQTARHVDPVLAARAQRLLGVALPCSLVSAVPYVDASSVGGSILGADGKVLRFAFGPMPVVAPPIPVVDSLGIPMPGEFSFDTLFRDETKRYQAYVGADFPTKPGATPLGIGSPAESVFIDVLRNAIVRRRVVTGAAHPDPTAAAAAGVVAVLAKQRATAVAGATAAP